MGRTRRREGGRGEVRDEALSAEGGFGAETIDFEQFCDVSVMSEWLF